MTPSKHWLEDGAPSELERLLGAARSEQPSFGSVERALLAAGIVGATSFATGTASGAAANVAGKLLLGSAAKWLAVGAIAGAGAVTTVTVVEYQWTEASRATPSAVRNGTARALATSSSEASRRRTSPSELRSQSAPEDSKRAADAPTVRPSAGAGTASPREPKAAVEPSPSSSSSSNGAVDRAFAEEMALVEAARARLRTGDAAGALRSVNEYERRYPDGRFAPEALFLSMQSHLRLGEPRAATDSAREIVRRFPHGAQVARARELLQLQGELENP